MKVKELIKLLENHNPDKQVVVRGYEDGYNDILRINELNIFPNPNQKNCCCGEYEDIAGFSFSAKIDDIKEYDYVLTPGRFVGAEDEEGDGIPFEEKFDALKETLEEQFVKADKLQNVIRSNMENKIR